MKKKINLKQYFEAMKITMNDMTIQIFHFNMIQVNTLVCYDETKEGVIIDPGMSSETEQKRLLDFIANENILVKYIINTHPHIDHVLGNAFCKTEFNAPLVAHKAGLPIYKQAPEHGAAFRFPNYEYPIPDIFIDDNENISFGNQIWKTIYTPGHADGSICLYDKNNNFVIVGDVIFAGSIGRTDLPTGNFKLLIQNITEKLLPLGDDVLVIPGHAETTTLGNEKMNNPYL
ncbi:MAG: MBL fold metallo-hydrolase [Bacteroidales bacterium]|jgi:glyoxylase-like metal-dependent hydrolase (beta-lactamase superfamily II)|nr:MBL fold metallo-hydrolase [Bacteroidales bacterium]